MPVPHASYVALEIAVRDVATGRPYSIQQALRLLSENADVLRAAQLKGTSCTVLPSDVRVWIEAAQRHVYPDVTVICGDPEFTDAEQDTLTNPTLLVEVLSRQHPRTDPASLIELRVRPWPIYARLGAGKSA